MRKNRKPPPYKHPTRRRRNKVNFNPQPMVTINRVKRVLEPKVPDDIDMNKLGEMYLTEGIKRGLQMALMLPQQLIDAVICGNLPTKVETIALLKQVKKALENMHRAALDNLEKSQADLESIVGYKPIDQDAVVEVLEADQFVRIITVPEGSGGGFCAELDPKHRGLGMTKREALEKLAEMLD